jgi:hypothetical protein
MVEYGQILITELSFGYNPLGNPIGCLCTLPVNFRCYTWKL